MSKPRFAALFVAYLIGCGSLSRVAFAAAQPVSPDVDPQRASLALDAIEPAPPAPPATAPPAPLSKRAAAALSAAQPLIAEQRYAEAGQELERALRYDPNHPLIHRALAQVAWLSGSPDSVRTHAGRALELDPNDVAAHYFLARAAAADARADEALRQFRLALLSKPAEPAPEYVVLTHYHFANWLNASGYLAAALTEFAAYEKAVADLRPPPPDAPPELAGLIATGGGDAAEPIAAIYEKLGRFADAATALQRVVQRHPTEPVTRAHYARLLSRAGRHEDALAEARRIQHDDALLAELLLEIHDRAGQRERAVDELRELLAKNPDRSEMATALVDLLSKLGRDEEAGRVLSEFLDRNPKQFGLWWKRFDLALSRSDWDSALAAAAAALDHEPQRFFDAQQHVAELAKHPAALDALLQRTADASIPRLPSTWYLLGVLARSAGQNGAAESRLLQAMRSSPRWVGPRITLAELYLESDRWTDAIQTAAPADQELEPHNRLEWILGQACAGLDNYDEAVSHFNQAINLNRADTDSMYKLGEVYLRIGKPLRAQRQFEAVLESQPLHEAAREELVGIYLTSERFAEAAEQFEKLKSQAAAPARLARVRAAVEQNPRAPDMKHFRETLEAGMRLGGRDAETLTLVARTHELQDDLGAARAALDDALRLDARYEPAANLLVEICARQLDFDRAEQVRRELLLRHPNRTAWQRDLCDILLNKQDLAGALTAADAYSARTDLPADDRRRFEAFGLQALIHLKRFDEAIARLKGALLRTPDDQQYRGILYALLNRTGRKDERIALARQAYDANPAELKLRFELIESLSAADQYPAAQQLVLDWLAQDPQNENYQLALAQNLSQAKRYDDALEVVRSIQESHRQPAADQPGAGPAELPLKLAELRFLQSANRHAAAADLLTDMLSDFEQGAPRPDSNAYRHSLQQELAFELVRAERYEQAAAKLTRWITEAKDPKDRFDYLVALRYLHDRRGQMQQAAEVLEMARQAQPDEVGVNNDLGYTLADMGVRLEEAERMIRFAVAREPRSAAYLDSLGWVLYKKGDFAGAAEWLRRATRADERDDPVIRDHLADALWRAGDKDEAQRTWREAQELLQKDTDRDDEDRSRAALRESLPKKLEQVQNGADPEVAPLAAP